MQKTPIFVDFDGTLFDTALMRDEIYDLFLKSGYKYDDIRSTYIAECMDYKFSPEGQYKKLTDIKVVNEKLMQARFDNMYQKVRKFVYPDSQDFLKEIDRSKFEVNNLTLGDLEFQTRKVNESGLAPLFDNIFITDLQKWDFMKNLVQPRDYFIIIDDRADTLEKIKAEYPKSLPIQIVRQDLDIDDAAKFYKEVFEGIKVHDLKQALRYLI